MRVLFWVQHLLGTGHLRRAVTLAEAMAGHGLAVTVASGGLPAPWLVSEAIDLVQLAPIRARDIAFTALVDAQDRVVDDTYFARRSDRLLALLEELQPRALITELYPFGRRAFGAELLPLLEAAAGARPRPWRLCSVRDILAAKPEPERYAWMRDVALEHYDRVLVHTDPDLIPFDLTFPYTEALASRLVSTGYVAPPPAAPGRSDERPGILISCGGGRVGTALLEAAIGAHPLSRHRDVPWRLITGGDVDAAEVRRLEQGLPEGVILEHQRADFHTLLANSLLSVSQAGYNTVVEALRFGRPMVLVPFETPSETEQRVRAERLASRGLAHVVWGSELSARRLAAAIDAALALAPACRERVRLDGAAVSAQIVADLVRAGEVPP